MLFVGVDPGKQGAIAVLDDAGHARNLGPIPIVPGGKGARDEYDLPAIRNVLVALQKRDQLFVTVEKPMPFPVMFRQKGAAEATQVSGTIANYNRGVSRGWEWMLTALGIPYLMVAPQTWQRAMLQGTPGNDTGQRSILAAKRAWPSVSLRRTPRSTKDDDGCADALNLAEYGRRQHRGGALFAAQAGA